MGVTIDILEPIENSKVVYQQIAPKKLGAPMQGRISILMRINNPDPSPVSVSKIDLTTGANTYNLYTYNPATQIAGGSSLLFQNANDNKYPGANALVVDEPVASTATIKIYLVGVATPIQATVMLQAHTNAGGPLAFAGKASDLGPNETWGATSAHPATHQVFALDIGVIGWDGSIWSDKHPGTTGIYGRDFRTYGMPLYAMADGTVGWALNDHTERALIGDDPATTTSSPTFGGYNAGGNQIFIKSGNEIHVLAHLQPGSIPPELLTVGATVAKGSYVGKAGLSGSTTIPAPHIHVKKVPASGAPDTSLPPKQMNGCDNGYFRPMAFSGLMSLTKAEAITKATNGTLTPASWTTLTNHSAPDQYGFLYPGSAGIAVAQPSHDTNQYVGAWSSGDRIQLRMKANGWTAFSTKWDELCNDGFRLVKVETCLEGTSRQFIGIFERGGGAHALWLGTNWEAFKAEYDVLTRKGGVRLIDLATYMHDEQRYYLAVYREGHDDYALQPITGWTAFTKKWAELGNTNLRLVALAIHPDGNDHKYIGVFRAGNYGHALVGITGWAAFTSLWYDNSVKGLRLIDAESFVAGGARQYVGVFRAGGGGFVLEAVTGYEAFIQAFEKNNAIGLRLDDVHIEP